MDVCRLIHQAKLTNEDAGEREFRDFFRDERRMRLLFERFIRNFYRRELPTFRVGRTRSKWRRTTGTIADLKLMPIMETDVTVISGQRLTVVEAKFIPEALVEHHGQRKLRSGHIYQLFAYLRNLASDSLAPQFEVRGILLYPRNTFDMDLTYQIHGHCVRVYAIDLDRPWKVIERNLLDLIDTCPLALNSEPAVIAGRN
jgi:5-methylcytosine-specific restriction enzyme subunit McrC